jgi:enolase-phosphatase E1
MSKPSPSRSSTLQWIAPLAAAAVVVGATVAATRYLLQRRRRAAEAAAAAARRPYDVLLFDIEGTTTPISFVKEVMFPYVTRTLPQYLEANYSQPQTRADIQALIDLAEADAAAGASGVVAIPRFPADGAPDAAFASAQKAAVIANVAWQMSSDRKSTALKQLQGHMWHDGFHSGELRGQLFGGADGDVATWFKRWKAAGYTLVIYSSGSVEAQKLLFGHSVAGDLTPLFSGNFDTKVGMKQEPASYANIAQQLGVPAERILFLTDIYGEAAAARASNVDTVILVRPGNGELPPDQTHQHTFPLANDFDEVEAFLEVRAVEKLENSTNGEGKAASSVSSTGAMDTSSGAFNTF